MTDPIQPFDSDFEPESEVVVRTAEKAQSNNQRKQQPRYNVILWDDDHHSYEYVIRLMQNLFAQTKEQAFESALEVDTVGQVICMTTTMELAELKRDQIHAFGKDELDMNCTGAMWATIEPVE